MKELEAFNARRRSEERPAYSVGIGINTGRMLMGSFGSENRLEYTVIGDCVNTAHRLSDLSKETPFYSVFIGEQTRRNVGDIPDWEIHSLGKNFAWAGQAYRYVYAISNVRPTAIDEF